MNNEFKPIRIVMIIQAYLPRVGGAERQIAAQAPLLQKLGVEVHIITRRYPGLESFEIINNVPIHRMPIIGPRPLAGLTFIISALWKINQINPDLIHAHELLSPTSVAILGKWWRHVPVLVKVLRGGKLGDISKITSGLFGRMRVEFIRRSVDMFAVISNEIDLELKSIEVSDERRVFLPNGVDVEKFSPIPALEKRKLRKRLGLPNGKLGIYSGRLEAEKNVDQLVSVWSRVRRKYGNANLIILGTGSEEKRLRASAGPGVQFYGLVENVLPFLRVADLYILPSSTEGLSNSLLEAMSCGLPVIATEVGAAPEMIKHLDSGWLIPPDAPAHLEKAINKLIEDFDLSRRMGKKARESVVKDYALPSIVLQLRRIYDKLLIR